MSSAERHQSHNYISWSAGLIEKRAQTDLGFQHGSGVVGVVLTHLPRATDGKGASEIVPPCQILFSDKTVFCLWSFKANWHLRDLIVIKINSNKYMARAFILAHVKLKDASLSSIMENEFFKKVFRLDKLYLGYFCYCCCGCFYYNFKTSRNVSNIKNSKIYDDE